MKPRATRFSYLYAKQRRDGVHPLDSAQLFISVHEDNSSHAENATLTGEMVEQWNATTHVYAAFRDARRDQRDGFHL